MSLQTKLQTNHAAQDGIRCHRRDRESENSELEHTLSYQTTRALPIQSNKERIKSPRPPSLRIRSRSSALRRPPRMNMRSSSERSCGVSSRCVSSWTQHYHYVSKARRCSNRTVYAPEARLSYLDRANLDGANSAHFTCVYVPLTTRTAYSAAQLESFKKPRPRLQRTSPGLAPSTFSRYSPTVRGAWALSHAGY